MRNTWYHAHSIQHTHTAYTRVDGSIEQSIHRFLTMDQHRLVVCSILEVGQRAADCRSIPTMAAPRLLNCTRTRVQALAWRCHRRAQGSLETSARSTCPRAALRESTAAVQQSREHNSISRGFHFRNMAAVQRGEGLTVAPDGSLDSNSKCMSINDAGSSQSQWHDSLTPLSSEKGCEVIL